MQVEFGKKGRCAVDFLNDSADAGPVASQEDLDKRGEPRRNIRAECQLCLFYGPEPLIRRADGVARNLSFKGIALVSDISEPIPPGRPVEVVVDSPNEPRTHAAGTVAYCSMIAAGCFEFGIRVEAAGADPILVADPAEAAKTYDWFAEALKVPQ